MPARPWLAVATSATLAVLLSALPAGAATPDPSPPAGDPAPPASDPTPPAGQAPARPTPDTPPSGPSAARTAAASAPSGAEIAAALDIPPAWFVSASIGESDPRGVAISDGVPIAAPDPDPDGPVVFMAPGAPTVQAAAAGDPLPFPSRGSTFLVLSTGDASHAMLPPSPSGASTVLDGLDNEQGNDKVQIELVLQAPQDARCLAMDVAFLSDEYPDFVGGSFNDAFTAQLGSGDMWIVDGAVDAPGNFARDSQGNPLTVNAAFDLQESTASTYDGATARLRSAAPVLGGREVTVFLTIQDLGDSVLDSAAFIDNVFFSEDALCRFGSSEDSDGDGLLDEWEENGFAMTVGGEQWSVDLPAMGADPLVKDVFVEIDYMSDATHSHAPRPAEIAAIVDSFARSGIQLHVDYGRFAPLTYGKPGAVWGELSQADQIPHSEHFGSNGFLSNSYSWRAFDAVKMDNFDPARAAIFHYNLWVHRMEEVPQGQGYSSGRSRGVLEGGSDFIVSLGNITSPGYGAGTFMHELGHNLGLGHGGDDHVNGKPNYLSVMNYDHQFRLPTGYPGPVFDYSFTRLADLDENDLDENVGIGITADLGLRPKYRCNGQGNSLTALKSQPIDWDCDGTIEPSVATSINRDGDRDVLQGHNDWRNLVFTGGAIGMPGSMLDLPEETVDPEPEATYETYLEVVGGAPELTTAPSLPRSPVTVGTDVAASLTFSTTAGDGGNMTAQWSWGDGAVSDGVVTAGETPAVVGTHVYTAPGTYEVSVTVVGPDGSATSPAGTVTVQGATTSRASATAAGVLRTTGAKKSDIVHVAVDARTVPGHSGPLGASVVRATNARLTVVGERVERLEVTGATAVVESRVLVNGRTGYRQRITLVDGFPARTRIQVWDPARGGPDVAAAVLLDTTSGANPAPTLGVLVDVRG
ncbi:choice-of-anchor L domain-containing protein [Cellulomonas phragmiteti]|uniref:PKD domain-containing protein n=1 Tax=Cellulomonas phragmiteti TaxID=478780 RepID=A0ABQ4DNK6_9CELL|nr:choice-of-anchor L domain-containing protein [Cellulomonas phragmiteti]GIG40923.1 hypothetical protein Cph01nite_26850 [Cellulomonas phragmiteti]